MRRAEVQSWQSFVRGGAHILARYPELVWPCAGNQPDASAVGRSAVELQEAGRWTRRPWLRQLNRPDAPDACLLDLRFDGYPTKVVLANEGRQILVAESPSWIAPNAGGFSLWEVDTGREVSRLPKPADSSVSAFLPDERAKSDRECGGNKTNHPAGWAVPPQGRGIRQTRDAEQAGKHLQARQRRSPATQHQVGGSEDQPVTESRHGEPGD
jgi:hypothetical protein